MKIGTLIWFFCLLVCGGVLLGTGIRWKRDSEPAGLWAAGKAPKPQDYTDMAAYNKAMGRVLKLYSLAFFISGFLFFWRPVVGGIFAAVACIGGIFVVFWAFMKLDEKYRK